MDHTHGFRPRDKEGKETIIRRSKIKTTSKFGKYSSYSYISVLICFPECRTFLAGEKRAGGRVV